MNKICTLRNMLARSRDFCFEKTALIDRNRQLTFGQLIDRTNRMGNSLLRLGLAKGDRVAVLSRNSLESGETYFSIPSAGLILVMLNFRLAPDEALSILLDSGASALIANEEYFALVEQIKTKLPQIRHFIWIGDRDKTPAGWLHYETLIDTAPFSPPQADIDEDDLAALMYTSGTTGSPKGCMVTHRNLYHVGRSMALEMQSSEDDVCIVPAPMFHASGLVVLLNGIYSGIPTVIQHHWDVVRFLELVEQYQVTIGILPTPMLLYFVNYPDCERYDLKSLRKVFFAGAPVTSLVFKRAIERFGNIFIHGFGTTETVGSICNLRTEDVAKALEKGNDEIFGSCGRSYIDTIAEIVNDAGAPVQPGEVGEIRSCGLGTTLGYWDKPAETARAFRNGWYYTEDLAMMDDDGYFHIVGRKKDMIITGGENVFPAEVENVLHGHPAVDEVAVIGIEDKRWAEAVTAFVVPRAKARVTEDDLRIYCRGHIAGYKVPKRIYFVDNLPISASGKVMKGKLREMCAATPG